MIGVKPGPPPAETFQGMLLNMCCLCSGVSLLAYTEQYIEYDPFLTPSDPSNPWISDDNAIWELEARCVSECVSLCVSLYNITTRSHEKS